jgi:hypothetical protein
MSGVVAIRQPYQAPNLILTRPCGHRGGFGRCELERTAATRISTMTFRRYSKALDKEQN